jgi:hypothetical protein
MVTLRAEAGVRFPDDETATMVQASRHLAGDPQGHQESNDPLDPSVNAACGAFEV